MTRGKKPDSAFPRKKRTTKRPPKLTVAAPSNVMEPKVNIKMERTRAGPNRLPSMATGGANSTYGTKKMEITRLYWPGLKLRSAAISKNSPVPAPRNIALLSPAVSAFPRFPLSMELKRSSSCQTSKASPPGHSHLHITANTGNRRKSNFRHKCLSAVLSMTRAVSVVSAVASSWLIFPTPSSPRSVSLMATMPSSFSFSAISSFSGVVVGGCIVTD